MTPPPSFGTFSKIYPFWMCQASLRRLYIPTLISSAVFGAPPPQALDWNLTTVFWFACHLNNICTQYQEGLIFWAEGKIAQIGPQSNWVSISDPLTPPWRPIGSLELLPRRPHRPGRPQPMNYRANHPCTSRSEADQNLDQTPIHQIAIYENAALVPVYDESPSSRLQGTWQCWSVGLQMIMYLALSIYLFVCRHILSWVCQIGSTLISEAFPSPQVIYLVGCVTFHEHQSQF